MFDRVKWTSRIFRSASYRFYWDNGFSSAAALAYTTLFSLVPVTALIFGLLASFAVSPLHIAQAREFIFNQFVPDTETANTVLSYLESFSETISDLNMLVMLFLVVSSLILINSIEYALNKIWQVFEARSIPNRIAIFCAILVLGPVLAISVYYTARFEVEPMLKNFREISYLYSLYNQFLPFAIDLVVFSSLYYLVPKAPVRFRSALFGAIVASLSFGMAKFGFTLYLVKFPTYEKVYGTIAAVPIFLFWLYLAWTIVLFGAECSYQYQYLPQRGQIWKKSFLSMGDAKFFLGLQSLILICRSFLAGKELPNELGIAEELGCSMMMLRPILATLEKDGFIAKGEVRSMPLTLLKAPERISLQSLWDSLIPSAAQMNCQKELSRLFKEADSKQAFGSTTLLELMS